MLSYLDPPIVVFVAESNGYIIQALKMGPEKSPAIINQNHSEHLIHTTSYNHLNWLLKLLYIFDWRFDHVIRRPTINSILNETSWMFFVTK